jgi:hypothetical protein
MAISDEERTPLIRVRISNTIKLSTKIDPHSCSPGMSPCPFDGFFLDTNILIGNMKAIC